MHLTLKFQSLKSFDEFDEKSAQSYKEVGKHAATGEGDIILSRTGPGWIFQDVLET